ncbi:MAG: acyl carrier protein [Acidobacteria bacterium]|jgi:acyl carrier protein|nr:acyl carrier protein [Acidobacteriota bacterium]
MSSGAGNGVEAAVREFLASRFPGYHTALGLEDPLDRVVDSLGLFDLVEWVEGSFGIRIPNEEFSPRRFASIAAICSTINDFR